jgi:outer membrane usher protein
VGLDLSLRGQPIVDWFDAPSEAALMLALETASFVVAAQDAGGGEVAPPAAAQPPAPKINPTARELRFIVPVSDGEIYLGDVELAVSPRDELSIEAPRLLQLLEPLLKAEVHQRLAAAVTPSGMLEQAALTSEGVSLSYDHQTLSLRMAIATENRLSRGLSLRAQRGQQAVTLEPARFSAYFNVRTAADLVQAGGGGTFVPPIAALDSAIRFAGIVAENESTVSARAGDPAFRRVGSRLVYEDLGREVRWTAGDAQIFPTRFQASPTVLGVGVTRLYGQIDPQREIRASGSQTFSVDRTSTIETFVNGRSVGRRTFQPGNYTLADFPLAEGANQVRLRIEEESGIVREIDFSAYANQALMARGVTEFSVFGGVYSEPSRTGLVYSRAPVASGFVRTGLTEQLTLGFNAQLNQRTEQVGADALWGSPVGLAGFALSASRSDGRGAGAAAAATFERVLSSGEGGRSRSFRAAAEWRSRNFAVPDVGFYQEATRLRASAGVVMSFGDNAYAAADGFYEEQWRLPPATAGERRYGARLTGGMDLAPAVTMTAELGADRGTARSETFLRLGVRLRLGERGSAQVDADTRGRGRASLSTAGGSGNRAWLASGDISHDAGSVALNAVGSLVTNRAEIAVQQAANWDTGNNRVTSARTTVRTGFALAFADGDFAVGRPVSEAFLVARPHKTLEGKSVYLEPSGDSEAAASGTLGPALHGQLSAHNFRTVIYQVPDAPNGYDLGAGNVAIEPPYRGGYKLVIGSDYHLLAIGRLLDASGEPISLLAGKAIDLGNPAHPAITIFTARNGRFGAQGLRPGRWRFEMPTEPATIFEFDVTDSPDGTVRLGDLRPTAGEPQ